MRSAGRRVVVGVITKAHGLRGAVIVKPETDVPEERFAVGSTFATDLPGVETLTVAASSADGPGLRIRFVEVTDRSAAEALCMAELTIDRAARRRLGDEEYWPDDLVGCSVVDVAGNVVGVVRALEFGEAQDRLVIETQDGAVGVLPFVAELVPMVDIELRSIVIDPPEEWLGPAG